MSVEEKIAVDRREIMGRMAVMGLSALTAMGGAALLPSRVRAAALDTLTAKPATARDLLVPIFLRGAADCLNVIVPHGDPDYYTARPTIAIPRPNPNDPTSAINLDGFFGLHPALHHLKPIWDNHQLALVHAAGSPDDSHSHFDAMQYMECGTPGNRLEPTGWLARHLQVTQGGNNSVFRALAMGSRVPQALRGQVLATSLDSIGGFVLSDDPQVEALAEEMNGHYYTGNTLLRQMGSRVITAIQQLRNVHDGQHNTNPPYPANSDLASKLKQVATLAHADLGMEVAWVDVEGWDTHVREGGSTGYMADLMTDLGQSLAAFIDDMRDRVDHLTIVLMTEFGRRVAENGGGTDHGHGACMMVLSGAVNGGQVFSQWPGLSPDHLYGPGDLQVTTDFRSVLAEISQYRLQDNDFADLFPNFTPAHVGLFGTQSNPPAMHP